jgi:hypothetical protein
LRERKVLILIIYTERTILQNKLKIGKLLGKLARVSFCPRCLEVEVPLHYEPTYAVPCAVNLTEEASEISMPEFPTGV